LDIKEEGIRRNKEKSINYQHNMLLTALLKIRNEFLLCCAVMLSILLLRIATFFGNKVNEDIFMENFK